MFCNYSPRLALAGTCSELMRGIPSPHVDIRPVSGYGVTGMTVAVCVERFHAVRQLRLRMRTSDLTGSPAMNAAQGTGLVAPVRAGGVSRLRSP